MGSANGDGFGYADFGSWYDTYRIDTLEPALDRAMDALQRELDDALSDRDLARIRSISGRVKSKRRTWRKVSQPRYRQRITTVHDIPRTLDDLIGIRLTAHAPPVTHSGAGILIMSPRSCSPPANRATHSMPIRSGRPSPALC